MDTPKPTKITKTMPINVILELVPDAVQLLEKAGLHCVGCQFNSLDTLEGGMAIHGKKAAEVNKMVFELNNLYKLQNSDARRQPTAADKNPERIEEGNKVYVKVAGMLFPENTIADLERLSEGKSGLAVRIEAGGCSGYTNHYDFVDGPKEDETAFALSEKLDLFMNDYTFDRLYESVVVYESGLHGSGLQFQNPNIKNACHCGKSFGF